MQKALLCKLRRNAALRPLMTHFAHACAPDLKVKLISANGNVKDAVWNSNKQRYK
jgi:hypothetical protein